MSTRGASDRSCGLDLGRFEVSAIVSWLIVWAIVAVGLYLAVTVSAGALFDIPVELVPWRVVAVSPFLALAMVRWPLVFPDMFYNLGPLVGHALLWVLTFILAFRFPLGYGVGVALISLLLIGPVASYTVVSLSQAPGAGLAGAASAALDGAAPGTAIIELCMVIVS